MTSQATETTGNENAVASLFATISRLSPQYHVLANANSDRVESVLDRSRRRDQLQEKDIAKIFKPVKKLPKRAQWLSKKSRPVSKQGPIAIPDKGSNAARAPVAKAEAAAEAKAAAKKPVAKKPVAKKAAPKRTVAKKK